MTWAIKPGPLAGDQDFPSVESSPLQPSCNRAPGPIGHVVDCHMLEIQTLPSVDRPRPTPIGGSRAMTIGEELLVAQIFGNSIDFSIVRIHRKKFIFFQPDDVTMAPDGNIYFNTTYFSEDFSLEDEKKGHFIHEMVHVWQHQLGYPVMFRGMLRIGLNYEYELDDNKKLSDYNMEAQGEIVSDYFLLKHLNHPHRMRMRKYADPIFIPTYEKVLDNFLREPSSKNNLP